MFIKHMKHDLLFGRNMFIALGIGIVITAVVGLITFHFSEDEEQTRNIINISVFLVLGLILGFVAVHLSQFIEKSLFGDTGYLALTLPVTRGRLLVSKILAAFTWYNYVLLAIFVGMVVLNPTQQSDVPTVVVLPPLGMNMIAIYLNLLFGFFFCVNIMLFGLTLHNSVFGKWKVPGFFTAVLCLGTVFGYAAAAIRMVGRYVETALIDGIEQPVPILGLDVGRLEMFGSYLDLYIAGMGLILGLAAFFATWYLLKKRVSLQ